MRAVSSGTGGTGCGRRSDMGDLWTRKSSNAMAPHKAADFANGVRSFSGGLWRPVHKIASQGLGHGVSFGQSFRTNLRLVSQHQELSLEVMLPARKTTGFLNKVIILALILSPRHLNFANIIRGIAVNSCGAASVA